MKKGSPPMFLLSLLLWGMTSPLLAKNLGVVGDVWPIQEKSLLRLLENRAAHLDTDSLQQKWQARARDYANRPKPLPIARCNRTKRHVYVPVVYVNQDIKDNDGSLIAPAGLRINALSRIPDYKPVWLFFNADDKAQLNWAIKSAGTLAADAKFILTGGSVYEAEKALQHQVYFDQNGVITKKLLITSVPALVVREQDTLRIDEMAIKESGDEV